MNERTINEQYKYIVELIEQKRLKEALTQLESFLWQCPDWELRNRLEQLQTSYNFMLQYMKQGIADPERKKLYIKLLSDTWEIADQARLLQLDDISTRYYHDVRKKRTQDLAAYNTNVLMHILESFNDDLAVSGLLSDSNIDAVLKRHEDTQKFMFLQTWSNSYWTTEDEADAQGMLKSELIPVNDLCLFTSAVMLSLMECFDLRKLMWLLDAYQHGNVYVSQRALIGIVFALHIHTHRLDLYPEIANRLKLLNEENSFDEDLVRIYRQLLLCQETEKIDKKMREEIIPEMLKNVSSMRNMKFGFEESDEEKDDRNPDWENVFEHSALGDKLREMNELQMEGADVYMSTFAPLKNFPFFKEPHNWFYPFDKQQSDVIKTMRKDGHQKNTMMDLLLQSGFFCSSDKYSLFFTMLQFPQSQRDMIFSQLTEQQAEEFAEQSKAETLKKFSERPATVSNQYLHDLYRFFKLNTRRNEFRDIFKEKIELHKISILKDILYQEGTLATIADYHLKKEHWAETTELYKEIERMNGPLSTQAEFYQKLGYAFQKQKRLDEALEAYQKADTIKPDNIWTNRHLAICYRLARNFSKALEYYRKAEETTPENHSIVFHIGSCLAELQQYEESLNYFFKLDFMESDCIKAWRGIAWCSFVIGKHEQATNYYNKVIDKKPLPMDYLNAGHVEWVSGDIEKAVSFYSRSKEMSGTKDIFLEMFNKDRNYLIQKGIAEDDIPLMLDLLY
ncbi:tetratricopeptide repeat protein [Bacteroides salyersiae]|uniref:tetratricopeptide repeat protein n=1 Tax=Bacteroides salyersiae TaxID=291644 RepID=UPI00397B2D90